MFKKILNFLIGISILFIFYELSAIICKILHLNFPPSILGLVLFASSLICGIIKEDWIKPACEVFINNMAMFLIPFWGGLILYQKLLAENWLSVLLVILITTTIIIITTGLFVEYGIKWLKLNNMRKHDD